MRVLVKKHLLISFMYLKISTTGVGLLKQEGWIKATLILLMQAGLVFLIISTLLFMVGITRHKQKVISSIFKGRKYYRWDIERDILDKGYPKLIRNNWTALSDKLDMAVYSGYSAKNQNNKLCSSKVINIGVGV
jgi:hypothetical protein